MGENLAALHSAVGRTGGELEYLGEDISKQSVEGAAWCLLAVSIKRQKEIN